jgi:methylated-DNA-[protein]-cysteine S-methyltransferase
LNFQGKKSVTVSSLFYLLKYIFMTNQIYFASDIINGIHLDVIVSDKGVREILINKLLDSNILTNATQANPEDSNLKMVFTQLKEYFNRQRKEFDLQLEIVGTDFQKKVWDELTKIPYGETISYGELAERMGNKNKMRAVAAANGANPIPIIIPCHRVIGADGSLTGYGGGLDVKKKLLELEGSWTMDLFIPS